MQSTHRCFTLPWGHGLHSLHWCFSLSCEDRFCPTIMHNRARLRLRFAGLDVRRRSRRSFPFVPSQKLVFCQKVDFSNASKTAPEMRRSVRCAERWVWPRRRFPPAGSCRAARRTTRPRFLAVYGQLVWRVSPFAPTTRTAAVFARKAHKLMLPHEYVVMRKGSLNPTKKRSVHIRT